MLLANPKVSFKNIPISIEISGLTLEIIHKLDKKFILSLKNLIHQDIITLIGSGYSQIIGPLTHKKINLQNLKEGKKFIKIFEHNS